MGKTPKISSEKRVHAPAEISAHLAAQSQVPSLDSF